LLFEYSKSKTPIFLENKEKQTEEPKKRQGREETLINSG
jgi:hypothetical protein